MRHKELRVRPCSPCVAGRFGRVLAGSPVRILGGGMPMITLNLDNCMRRDACIGQAAADSAAWFMNVLTSVAIVFVNKVLMDPKAGYKFAFGALGAARA